jgi:hypothetical protein
VHGVGLGEHVAEVGEQTGAERGLGVVLRIERDRGFPGPGGPVAAARSSTGMSGSTLRSSSSRRSR